MATRTSSRIEIRLLGGLGVSTDGQTLDVTGPKQRALLAYLALHANETVAGDLLVDALWGERPPPTAPSSLRVTLSKLRRRLAEVGLGDRLVTSSGGYTLCVEPDEVDVLRFASLAALGRSALELGDAREAADTLRRALALWSGPALADLAYEPFASAAAARLEEDRLAALEARIEADLRLGRHRELVGELEALAAAHPLREAFAAQLMLALYRSGRQAEALAAYQGTRAHLVEELGIEPGTALRELERAILVHDPSLDAQAASTARPLSHPSRRRPALALGLGLLAAGALAGTAGIVLGSSSNDGQTATRPATGSVPVFGPGVRSAPVSSSASEAGSDTVAVLDARTYRVLASVPVGAQPKRIAAGAGGLWVVNGGDSTVSRIDPERRVVVRTIPLPGKPSDVAVTEGDVWVLHNAPGPTEDPFSGIAALSRIDPTFNTVSTTMGLGSGFGNTFADPAAVGPQGIWVGWESGLRLSSVTGEVVAEAGLPWVTDVAVDGEKVWATLVSGELAVADEDGTATRLPLDERVTPVAVGVGPDAVWVASRRGSSCCPARYTGAGTVFRLSREAEPPPQAAIRVGGDPTAIAVGAGGVWVADGTNSRLVHIDPDTNEIVARVKLPARPTAVAAADGFVWVALA